MYRGWRYSLALAFGGAIIEAIYAYLAFWGFGRLLDQYPWVDNASKILTVVLLISLGAVLMLARPLTTSHRSPVKSSRRGLVGSFLLGITIAVSNPILLATWSSVVMVINSLDILTLDTARAVPYSVGVALGIVAWFATLLTLLQYFRERLKEITLHRTISGFGLVLLIVGTGLGLHYLLYSMY
ncbi:LysE family transporter [Pseudomonadota bacterium]